MRTWTGRAGLSAKIRRAAGPLDELDEEANGDPGSTLGEDDDTGFDDDPWGAEPQVADDGGFDGAPMEDDDEDPGDGGEAEEEEADEG